MQRAAHAYVSRADSQAEQLRSNEQATCSNLDSSIMSKSLILHYKTKDIINIGIFKRCRVNPLIILQSKSHKKMVSSIRTPTVLRDNMETWTHWNQPNTIQNEAACEVTSKEN